MKAEDWLGWTASAVLLATLGRQVYVEWREHTTKGVSAWLFVGQVTASIGFIAYSWLLHNVVFVCTNAAILATAMLGQWTYWHNRQRTNSAQD